MFSSPEQELEVAETLCEPSPCPASWGGVAARNTGTSAPGFLVWTDTFQLKDLHPFYMRQTGWQNQDESRSNIGFSKNIVKVTSVATDCQELTWASSLERDLRAVADKYGHFYWALLYIHPAKANRWVGNENQEGKIYMFLIILP